MGRPAHDDIRDEVQSNQHGHRDLDIGAVVKFLGRELVLPKARVFVRKVGFPAGPSPRGVKTSSGLSFLRVGDLSPRVHCGAAAASAGRVVLLPRSVRCRRRHLLLDGVGWVVASEGLEPLASLWRLPRGVGPRPPSLATSSLPLPRSLARNESRRKDRPKFKRRPNGRNPARDQKWNSDEQKRVRWRGGVGVCSLKGRGAGGASKRAEGFEEEEGAALPSLSVGFCFPEAAGTTRSRYCGADATDRRRLAASGAARTGGRGAGAVAVTTYHSLVGAPQRQVLVRVSLSLQGGRSPLAKGFPFRQRHFFSLK